MLKLDIDIKCSRLTRLYTKIQTSIPLNFKRYLIYIYIQRIVTAEDRHDRRET